MTTRRTYICNLCSVTVKPSFETSKEGFGVEFMGSRICALKRVSEAENHICVQCARGILDEFRKVMPAAEGDGNG